jgi:hypothetical protein
LGKACRDLLLRSGSEITHIVVEQVKIASSGAPTVKHVITLPEKQYLDSLWRCCKPCIIVFRPIIDRHDDTVVFLPATIEVAHLEVESTLVEPIPISEIVHSVHDVESIYDRSI